MENLEAKEIVSGIVTSLDKHKAQDIRVIGVTDVTTIADYFVIAAGTSSTQVKSLTDYVEEEMEEKGVRPPAHGGVSLLHLDPARLRERGGARLSRGDPPVL